MFCETFEISEVDDLQADDDYTDDDTDIAEPLDVVSDHVEANCVRFSSRAVPVTQVDQALSFFRSSAKGFRSLDCMSKRFRFLKTAHDMNVLRSYEKDREHAISNRNQLLCLEKELIGKIREKFQDLVSLHDCNIRAMALDLNKTMKVVRFSASQSWLSRFKQRHRIVSRHITTFVSTRTLRSRDETERKARETVENIKSMISSRQLPFSCVVNTDQSAFDKEMPGKRSLAEKGVKVVERVVQAKSSLTHSATVMPTIRADGTVNPKLFVVLPERDGRFPNTFTFSSSLMVIRAAKTHIMNKNLLLDYVRECIVHPEMPETTVMVCDSWSSFKDHEAMKSVMPPGKELVVVNIPPGATSMIQPLDVGFFRTFKAFEKHIYSQIMLEEQAFRFATRENWLKVLEVTWCQFLNPRFRDFIRYAWYKPGFLTDRPVYDTPLKFCFPKQLNSECQGPGCGKMAIFQCSYCNGKLCFHHLVVLRHTHSPQ